MLRPGGFEMLVVLQVPTNKQLSRGPQATMMPHGAACCWSLASPLSKRREQAITIRRTTPTPLMLLEISSWVVPPGRRSKKASPERVMWQ